MRNVYQLIALCLYLAGTLAVPGCSSKESEKAPAGDETAPEADKPGKPKAALCLSKTEGEVDGRSVCVTKKEVVMKPEGGDYAHATWHLHFEDDGTPVEKGVEVVIDSKQWVTTMPPDMPPIEVPYTEKMAEDGILRFHVAADWSNRRMEFKLVSFEKAGRAYVGDGDMLAVEANK